MFPVGVKRKSFLEGAVHLKCQSLEVVLSKGGVDEILEAG
jgi:hypothetical protein